MCHRQHGVACRAVCADKMEKQLAPCRRIVIATSPFFLRERGSFVERTRRGHLIKQAGGSQLGSTVITRNISHARNSAVVSAIVVDLLAVGVAIEVGQGIFAGVEVVVEAGVHSIRKAGFFSLSFCRL